MNKKSLILLPVAMLFLAGCNNDTTPSSSTSSSETPTPTPSTSTTTSQTVTVNYGTLTAPLSIAEFNTEVAKLGLKDNEFSTEHFFVKGYVYADPTYSSDSSSYLLKLTDGKESEAYINAGGVKLDTGVEEPYKNDTVVVEGLAKLYGTNYSIWSTKTDSPALKSVTRGTSTVTSSIENGTITGLNATYTNGATASFAVTANSGYSVSNVSAYGTALTATDGKYSFKVTGDCEVEVTILQDGVTVNYGTAESPLTVAEFYTEAAKLGLGSGEFSTEHFFVEGYVDSSMVWNEGYGNFNKFKLATAKGSETMVEVSGAKRGEGVSDVYHNDTIVLEGLAEVYNDVLCIYFDINANDYPSIIKVENGVSAITTSIENGTISGLEASYTNGATASFTVTANSGYSVAMVNVSTEESALEAADGVYSFIVKGDAIVKVTLIEGELGTKHTVVFNSTNNQDKIQNYTSEWKNISDGVTYKVENFNNNNNGWDGYIKAGSKKAASVASISTTTAFTKAIVLASIDVQAITAANVNSFKLIVASDANFTTVVEEINIKTEEGVQVASITKSTESCFYKFVLDLKQGSGNGFVQIGNLAFTESAK